VPAHDDSASNTFDKFTGRWRGDSGPVSLRIESSTPSPVAIKVKVMDLGWTGPYKEVTRSADRPLAQGQLSTATCHAHSAPQTDLLISLQGIAVCIMMLVLVLIVTEIIHRTLASMLGSTMAILVLAMQHRMPTMIEIMVHQGSLLSILE